MQYSSPICQPKPLFSKLERITPATQHSSAPSVPPFAPLNSVTVIIDTDGPVQTQVEIDKDIASIHHPRLAALRMSRRGKEIMLELF